MHTATILLCCSVGILFLSAEVEGNPKPKKEPDYFDACRSGKAKGTPISDTNQYAMGLLGEAVKKKQISIITVKGVEKETNAAGDVYNFDITARNIAKTERCCTSIQEKTKQTKTNCPQKG